MRGVKKLMLTRMRAYMLKNRINKRLTWSTTDVISEQTLIDLEQNQNARIVKLEVSICQAAVMLCVLGFGWSSLLGDKDK